jgi:hypothetical protein
LSVGVLLALDAVGARAADPRVEVRREGHVFLMSAEADVRASPQVAWQTMTDYAHLPQFIPGIRSAQVIDRRGDPENEDLTVEERGDARFLVFGQSIRIRMDVHQEAPREILAHGVPWPGPANPGEVEPEEFDASYRLEPIENGVRIVYSARIVPSVSWPDVVERLALRQNASLQFRALIAEIARRERDAAGAVQ